MALGADYVTPAELKSEFGFDDFEDETELILSISSASLWVNSYCGRDFNDAGTATARTFHLTGQVAVVDDFHTTTGLVVKTDSGNDGTFETTWSASDYQLEPLNGVANGLTGWPYTKIRFVDRYVYRTRGGRPVVEVTAQWGWASVPAPVKKATMIQAARLFKRRHSPEGILGGSEQFGAVRVGSRLDPDVQALLDPYRRTAVLIA